MKITNYGWSTRQFKLSSKDEMVTGYAGLLPGVDAEPTEYCRRMRLDGVLASAQMSSGCPDIHPSGQAAENSFLSRS